MPSYPHGGDIWNCPAPPLDFSSNLHPLGMPPAVAAAARAAGRRGAANTQPLGPAHRGAHARPAGGGSAPVVCGGGAAELIFRLCLALRPREALITAPTFSEYEQALRLFDCRIRRFPLAPEEGFALPERFLKALTPGLDLLFLCTPNNPTGRCIPLPLLERIAARCREVGARLVLDECFMELTDRPQATALLERFPNLFLLRAFTKTYAVPGLRLGYGLSADGDLLERLWSAGPPWSVSTVAQAAGLAACGCPDWPERGREILRRERPRLMEGLMKLGLTVWPGEANYLLFRAPGVTDLKARLTARGVLLRSCANYPSLTAEDYRVCVRTEADNDILLNTLQEVL